MPCKILVRFSHTHTKLLIRLHRHDYNKVECNTSSKQSTKKDIVIYNILNYNIPLHTFTNRSRTHGY